MSNKKPTDNEIKKALEWCAENLSCTDCPLRKTKSSCSSHFLDLINRQEQEIEEYKVDKEEYIKDYEELENNLKYAEEERKFEHQRVINLQAEIERLKTKNAVILKQSLAENKTTATAIMTETKQHIMTAEKIKRLKEEIDRLQIAQFQFISEINAYKEKLKTAKAEAYKEFAERLYTEFRMYGQKDKFNKAKFLTAVDNLLNELKEMEGKE